MAKYRKFKGKHLVIFFSHIHYNYLYSCLITRGRPFDKGIVYAIGSVVTRVVTSIMRCTQKLCLRVKLQHLQWRSIIGKLV